MDRCVGLAILIGVSVNVARPLEYVRVDTRATVRKLDHDNTINDAAGKNDAAGPRVLNDVGEQLVEQEVKFGRSKD